MAATLTAGEIGSEHTQRAGWLASYAPDVEIIGYLDHVIPGPTSIMDLRGSLGRSLQHTLLRYEDGHQWPFVEKWELDWAVADPVGYQDRRVPEWVRARLTAHESIDEFSHRRAEPQPSDTAPRPHSSASHNDELAPCSS